MNNGRNCDNCESHLNDENYISYGSWFYTCHECGFVHRHGLGVNEQVEKFNTAKQSAQDGEGEEIDPVTQALRNLGDAIAPPRQ